MKLVSAKYYVVTLIIIMLSSVTAYCTQPGIHSIPQSDTKGIKTASPSAEEVAGNKEKVTSGRSRYLSFNIWGWNLNGKDLPLFKRVVESARAKGFNTISLAFPWAFIEKSQGTFDFKWLDQRVDYILEQGLHVQLRVIYMLFPGWIKSDYFMRKEDGRVFTGELSGRELITLSDFRARKWMETLLEKTVTHYKQRHPANPVIFYSVSIGPAMETEYPFNSFVDYSPPAQKDFREWLMDRYKRMTVLNKRWNTSYKSLSHVRIPGRSDYGSSAWADWMKYRTFALKRLIDQLAETVHRADKDAKIGVHFAEYAMRFDSAARGTYNIPLLIENVDWVIFEDGPTFDHRFSMDLLRSVAKGKRIGQELSPLPSLGYPAANYVNQALTTFDSGGDLVLFANWDWAWTGGKNDGRISFKLKDVPVNYPAYAAQIAQVAEKASHPVNIIKEPQVALYISTMMQYLHPKCNCPGFYKGVMHGVDTYRRVKTTYKLLTDGKPGSVAFLTDHLVTSDPSILKQYTEGIYLPAFNQIISDDVYNALSQAGAPLYAENSRVGTRNEYGDARKPDIFNKYPQR